MGNDVVHKRIALDSVVVVSEHQASADLGDEAVVLNLETGVYYRLDDFGAYVWKLIQEPRTVRAVRDTLLEAYDDADPGRCEDAVISVLRQLAQLGLVTIVDEA